MSVADTEDSDDGDDDRDESTTAVTQFCFGQLGAMRFLQFS